MATKTTLSQINLLEIHGNITDQLLKAELSIPGFPPATNVERTLPQNWSCFPFAAPKPCLTEKPFLNYAGRTQQNPVNHTSQKYFGKIIINAKTTTLFIS